MSGGELPPIQELIPHRGRSILLDRLINHDGDSTTVKVVVGSQPWMRQRDGTYASWLAVEYMAQCVAAHEGMLARSCGRDLPLGFLVGVRRLRLEISHFDRGEELRVSARRIGGRPGLGVLAHACAICVGHDSAGAEPIAEGRLSIAVQRIEGEAGPAV